MKVFDAYLLARTKRRTRRIRTALVTTTSALLFSGLFFGAFLVAGLQQSAANYTTTGFNRHYLTSVFDPGSYTDYEIRQQEVSDAMDKELRADGRRVDDALRESQDYQEEFSRRLARAQMNTATARQLESEATVKKDFAPTATYHMTPYPSLTQNLNLQTDEVLDPTLHDLQTGKTNKDSRANIMFGGESASFMSVEEGLLKDHTVNDQSLQWSPGQPYPLLLPYTHAFKLAGTSLTGLNGEQKVAAYKKIITDYSGKELSYCYRNQPAQDLLAAAWDYNEQLTKKPDASKKAITLQPCSPLSNDELKKADLLPAVPSATDPKPLFPRPKTPDPLTQVVTFRVAGFLPSFEMSGGVIEGAFSSVNSWPGGNPLAVPQSVVDSDATLQKLLAEDQSEDSIGFISNNSVMYDFATREQQKAFIATGCKIEECTNGTKPYIQSFGNLSVALEDIASFLVDIATWVVGVIGVIAALMISMTISKVIADSAKEIAVFRSLGATRFDIAQIYFTYGLMLAGSALLLAVLIGAGGALAVNHLFNEMLSNAMVSVAGAYTDPQPVGFFGVHVVWLSIIGGALFGAATIGIAIPVLSVIRRNLMKQMREE